MLSTLRSDTGDFARSWIAELVGTFFLLLVILVAPANLTFAAAGAIVLTMVVAVGKVSGTHLNPAVTTGLVTARKFPLLDGLVYLVAQVIGAFVAFAVVNAAGRKLPAVRPGDNAFFFEMLGAGLLVFVVTRVTVDEVPEAGSALAIGTALALGILISAPSSGGVLNPAIGLVLITTGIIQGAGARLLPYILAPLLGGVVAGLLGRYLASVRVPEDDTRHEAIAL